MKEYIAQLLTDSPSALQRRLLVREYLQARILEGLREQGAFPGILNAPARAGIPIRRHRRKTHPEVRG